MPEFVDIFHDAALPDTDASRRMFDSCDADGDGKLSKQEICAVLDSLKVRQRAQSVDAAPHTY